MFALTDSLLPAVVLSVCTHTYTRSPPWLTTQVVKAEEPRLSQSYELRFPPDDDFDSVLRTFADQLTGAGGGGPCTTKEGVEPQEGNSNLAAS